MLIPIKNITDSAYGADPSNSDNKTQIQSALTGGGGIWIPQGVFNVSDTLNITSDTKIFGPGTLKLTSNSNVPLLKADGSVTAVKNVQIEQITLDGNASIGDVGTSNIGLIYLYYVTNAFITNVTITNAVDFAIAPVHVDHLKITGCQISKFRQRAIDVLACFDTIITNNDIDGQYNEETKGREGIEYWGGSYPGPPVSGRHVVANNIVRNLIRGGIWTSEIYNMTITGNLVENCDDVGIDVEGSTYVSITGNFVTNCINGCITTIQGSSYITISGNTIKQPSNYYGIYIQGAALSNHITISSNNIQTEAGYGIFNAAGCLEESLIEANVITTKGISSVDASGIFLAQANGVDVIGNKVTVGTNNNVMAGIVIAGGCDCLIHGNSVQTLHDTSEDAPDWRGGILLIYATSTYPTKRNTVTDNLIRGFQVGVNDNCWADSLSYNVITYNRLDGSVSRRNMVGYNGVTVNNITLGAVNPIVTNITPTLY